MNPVTFMVLVVLSLLAAIGLLFFAPGFLVEHGPLLVACWSAGMILYVACAYFWAWLEDREAEAAQAELGRLPCHPPGWEPGEDARDGYSRGV